MSYDSLDLLDTAIRTTFLLTKSYARLSVWVFNALTRGFCNRTSKVKNIVLTQRGIRLKRLVNLVEAYYIA